MNIQIRNRVYLNIKQINTHVDCGSKTFKNFLKKTINKLLKKSRKASRFCVSSLRRGHANLLCIVPILLYVLPKQVHRVIRHGWYIYVFVYLDVSFLYDRLRAAYCDLTIQQSHFFLKKIMCYIRYQFSLAHNS